MKLLDTSVLVDIDRGDVERRVEKLDQEGRHAISVVTVTELQLGVNKRYEEHTRRQEATGDLERLLSRFDTVGVTKSVATMAADIIAELQQTGKPLYDLHDVYIAATARVERLSVLTANVDHFERVEDVPVVEWTEF